MSKENLFEDITLEQAKAVLQEVSEYMGKVIEGRRTVFYAKGEPYYERVNEDEMWNLAHDVLEIIHCPADDSLLAKAIIDSIEDKIKPLSIRVEKLAGKLVEKINEETKPRPVGQITVEIDVVGLDKVEGVVEELRNALEKTRRLLASKEGSSYE